MSYTSSVSKRVWDLEQKCIGYKAQLDELERRLFWCAVDETIPENIHASLQAIIDSSNEDMDECSPVLQASLDVIEKEDYGCDDGEGDLGVIVTNHTEMDSIIVSVFNGEENWHYIAPYEAEILKIKEGATMTTYTSACSAPQRRFFNPPSIPPSLPQADERSWTLEKGIDHTFENYPTMAEEFMECVYVDILHRQIRTCEESPGPRRRRTSEWGGDLILNAGERLRRRPMDRIVIIN
jgi:hypothetical protein